MGRGFGVTLRDWLRSCAWMLVGAAYAVSLLAMLTIGPFVAPVALAATVLFGRMRRKNHELLGLVSGLALPMPRHQLVGHTDTPGLLLRLMRAIVESLPPYMRLALHDRTSER